jgi:hypothetical protein
MHAVFCASLLRIFSMHFVCEFGLYLWKKFHAQIGAGTGVLVLSATVAIVGSSLYARAAAFVFGLQTIAISFGFICLLVRPAHTWMPSDGGVGNSTAPYVFTAPSMDTLKDNLWCD